MTFQAVMATSEMITAPSTVTYDWGNVYEVICSGVFICGGVAAYQRHFKHLKPKKLNQTMTTIDPKIPHVKK